MNWRSIFLCLSFPFIFTQCEDKDKYYERPDWLEDPIYEVLEQKGNFSQYLKCVDKTEYALVLKGAGLYTVFAPNDAAMTAYLTSKSYNSIDDIPKDELQNLVAYSIVYSAWTSDHLSDYLKDKQYVLGAFKKKTNCYALPYTDPEFDNKWVFNQTLVGGVSHYSSNYEVRLASNNYKFLPIFTDIYFSSFPTPLTAGDYNTFFPNSAYTGINVQEGTIINKDILAENGVIHEVSTVSEPLNNIDEILRNPIYSGFKELLDSKNTQGKYVYKEYIEVSSDMLEMFKKMRPDKEINDISYKRYNLLAFSPLLENVYSEASASYDAEQSGNTLFVPKNESLEAYIQSRLLKYYGTKDKLPQDVITTLINTHMVNSLIWPSMYKAGFTSTGEYLNGEGTSGKDFAAAGILSSKMASNGFVYSIDNVIKSKYFETVYSEIFLNPTHEWLNQAYVNFYSSGLREDLMKSILSGYSSERYTLLNFSDDLLREDGYTLNSTVSPPAFANSNMPSAVDDRLKRLMRMHIFPGLKNNEVDSEITDFSKGVLTNYQNWGFLVNTYGDMVRYKDNMLQAAGNIEDDTYVTVTEVDVPFNNGKVFNVDGLLQYSPRESAIGDDRWKDLTLWKYLERAKEQNANVSEFVDYVRACLKNPETDDLDGIKTENFYTVLMVNNTAMKQARSRGYLADLSVIEAGNDLVAKAKATQFLNAHFLQGAVLPDDGYDYIYPVNPMSPNKAIIQTIHKVTDEKLDLTSASTRVEVTKNNGVLIFTPQNITLGTKVLVEAGFGFSGNFRIQRGAVAGSKIPNNFRSNRIACKAVLHEVNNFFTYTLKYDN